MISVSDSVSYNKNQANKNFHIYILFRKIACANQPHAEQHEKIKKLQMQPTFRFRFADPAPATGITFNGAVRAADR